MFKHWFYMHLARLPQELTEIGFRAELEWMCDKMNLEYDGRRFFLAAR